MQVCCTGPRAKAAPEQVFKMFVVFGHKYLITQLTTAPVSPQVVVEVVSLVEGPST